MKLDRKHILLFFIFFTLIFSSCQKENRLKVENGQIDLSTWNSEKDGILKLDGTWEFYHNQLLTPSELINNSNEFTYQKFPSNWGKYKINGEKISGTGTGTYRLKIFPNSKDSLYIIKLGRIDVSYKLFANNKLIAQAGEVSENKEGNIPEWKTQTAEIKVTDTIELVLQITNFRHKKGGAAGSIEISTPEKMLTHQNILFAYDFFLLGLLIIMAIYHLGLFYLRKADLSVLFFAILLVFVAIHLTVGGQFRIKFFFPNINWELLMKINYLGNYLRIYFFALFSWFLFKGEISKWFVRILLIVSVIMALIIVFTSASIYTHFFIFFVLVLAISFPYLVYGMIKAVIRKREGSVLSLIGTLIILLSALNDVLYSNLLINTGYLVPFGLFLFIFFQSFLISVRFSKSFNRAENLSLELKSLNQNLENRVSERTLEIEQQKEELRAQANNLLETNETLGATNNLLELNKEELTVKNEEINKQNKDIRSSIKYAKRLQDSVLPPENEFAKYFQDYFILFKPRDIVSGDFYYLEQIGKYKIIVAADCTGHGVPGAFMSMLSITLIQEILRYKELENTGELLNELRKKVILALKQDKVTDHAGDGLDISLLVIDEDANKMFFSGAYNSFFIIRNNQNPKKLEVIKGDRMPIGTYIGKLKPFTTKEFRIEKNDSIYLFTDGFKDQFGGEKNMKFMNKRFKKMIFDNHHKKMSEQNKIYTQTIDNWINTGTKINNQLDDILLLGIKI